MGESSGQIKGNTADKTKTEHRRSVTDRDDVNMKNVPL